VKYLKDHDKTLFPYVIAMQWNEDADIHGHVIVALDGEYIDLTLDQFEEYKDWVVAEPIESCGQISSLLRKVRHLKGSITTRKVTLMSFLTKAIYCMAGLKPLRTTCLLRQNRMGNTAGCLS
jgi:hypothetical protein